MYVRTVQHRSLISILFCLLYVNEWLGDIFWQIERSFIACTYVQYSQYVFMYTYVCMYRTRRGSVWIGANGSQMRIGSLVSGYCNITPYNISSHARLLTSGWCQWTLYSTCKTILEEFVHQCVLPIKKTTMFPL